MNDLSAPVGSWSNSSITIMVPNGAPSASGYLVVSEAASMNDSNPVDFTVTSSPLPSPWLTQDINTVTTTGSASYSTGTFTVNGGGIQNSGIGGTADYLYFVYQQVSGDGTIVARLPSLQGSNSYAQAGLMIRETLNPGATVAFMSFQNANSGQNGLIYRTTTGANAGSAGGPDLTLPYWFMLIRSGNTFTAYTAPDGVNWTQVSSQTITMASNVYIGLAVSSQANNLATATFDHVAVSNSASVITPSITSLTPAAAPIGGTITIQGTDFGSSQSSSTAQFNNIAASVLSWSSTSIKVSVPSNATSGPVTVTVGGIVSNGVQFTLIESLSISGISPTSGPIGTSLTITGTGFGPSQSNSIAALYGATVTNITSWTDTSIIAIVPAGSATGPVALTVAGNNVQGPTFVLTSGANVTDSLGNTSSYQAAMTGGLWVLTNSQGSGWTTCTVRGVISSIYDGHSNMLLTRPSFCTTASERVYITASGCETELGGTTGL